MAVVIARVAVQALGTAAQALGTAVPALVTVILALGTATPERMAAIQALVMVMVMVILALGVGLELERRTKHASCKPAIKHTNKDQENLPLRLSRSKPGQ